MSDERGWSDPYDEISEFISSCEVNGTTANKLDSCESIAPFLRCVYKKLRSHKHGSPLVRVHFLWVKYFYGMKLKLITRPTLLKYQEVYKQYVEKCKANANIDREELVTLLEPGTAVTKFDFELNRTPNSISSVQKTFWLFNFRFQHCLANKRASFAAHRIIW